MPYIKPEDRTVMDNGFEPTTDGELNYVITKLVRRYLYAKAKGGPIRYTMYNEVIGVLECAKQELYRRMIAPYEDEKIKENGDVY